MFIIYLIQNCSFYCCAFLTKSFLFLHIFIVCNFFVRFAPLLTSEKLGLVCGEDQSVGLGQLPELGALMLKEYITISINS